MTMENMVKWLENKGFVTDKTYDSCRKKYIFTIKKGDKFCVSEFEFPETSDYKVRDEAQRAFLNQMMGLWNKAHGDSTNEKKSFGFNDLQGCTLITRNGVRMVVSIDEMNVGSDGDTTFEGHFYHVDGGKGFNRDYRTHDGYRAYAIADEMVTHKLADRMSLTIKNVIFNDPATIVFWQDGTKTVVKCQDGDRFDPEKGLAMAIAKKVYGNKGNYCNQLKKWLPKEEKPILKPDVFRLSEPFEFTFTCDNISKNLLKGLTGAIEKVTFTGVKVDTGDEKPAPKKRMTFREEVAKLEPERISSTSLGGVAGCPTDQLDDLTPCPIDGPWMTADERCRKCWDREIPEELMRDDI